MEKKSLQEVVLGKLDSYTEKNEIRTVLNTIQKNKLKMDQRPNLRQGTIKLLEENNKKNIHWHKTQQDLLTHFLRVMKTKNKQMGPN